MKNTFNKITQPIFEAFKGPRTKDFEFDRKVEEYKLAKEKMFTAKSIIDNYNQRLEGYKLTLTSIVSTFDLLFDRNQTYYSQFMGNVVSAHKTLNDKLRNMFTQIEKLKNEMLKWNQHTQNVENLISQREGKRKEYEHYDEKMTELYEERNKIITKGKIPNDKENEKYIRNIQKFQKSAKEYIEATNLAYKNICQFLDARYENITLAVVGFIEIESAFYNEAHYIFNFFNQIRNQISSLRSTFIPSKETYNAADFVRGGHLLNIKAEELIKTEKPISGIIEGIPNYKQSNIQKSNTYNQGSGYSNNQGGYNQNQYGYAPNNSYNPNFSNNNQSYYNNYNPEMNEGHGIDNNNNSQNIQNIPQRINPYESGMPQQMNNPFNNSQTYSSSQNNNPFESGNQNINNNIEHSSIAPNPYGDSNDTNNEKK